ncbi:MAG: HTTM domain-containing protein, partial [Cyanobacteria bacterium HKST-UBA01]|nr:HTTM domain-containing protein [Cyanobacteria bacterium HKST-UBA01]
MSIKTISKAVDRFLFAPTSPYPVAAFRILFGLLLLQHSLLIYSDLYNWYGAKALALSPTVDLNNPYVCLNLFKIFPDNDLWLTAIYAAYVLAALALTLGYRSRMASILLYLIIVSFYHRDPYLLNSGDTLVRVMSFWIVFAPTGAAWSLDHRRKVKKYGFEFTEL